MTISSHPGFFETLVEEVGCPIAAYDREGRFVYANEAYADLLGTTPGELVGRPLWRVNPAFDQDRFDGYWRSLDPGETRVDETVHERDDGQRLSVEAITTRQDFDGTAYHFGTIRDVGNRVERERTLEALHEASRRLMEATTRQEVGRVAFEITMEVIGHENCGIWLVDEAERVLRPAAVGGDDANDVVLGEESFMWHVFDTGEPDRYEHVQERDHPEWDGDLDAPRDAGIRSMVDIPLGDHGVYALVSYEDDELDDATVSFATVLAANTKTALDRASRETTLRTQRHELQRQNEQLEQLASVLSHDLRNPLNVAQGSVSLAREECGSDHLANAADALARMETLIEDLLELARSGQRVGETVSVSLRSVAERAWETVDVGDASLAFEPGLDTVDADPGRLQQLLENLFRNAVEHGSTSPGSHARQDAAGASSGEPSVADAPEDAIEHASSGPTITVGTTPGGFYVADDGVGLPETGRDRLFEFGFSTSDGTGLGLAIVEGIVDAHGWSIDAVDGADGGARFEVTTAPEGRDADPESARQRDL